jgi:glycosyltransferase involved in cell wall biosynthesis
MRIAYDHQIFSGQKYGGISKYYYQLVKNISKTDNRVRIFSPIHRNYYIQNLPQELVKGVKLDKYPFGSYGDKIVTEINRVLLKPILNQYQPDIIHETFFSKHKSGSMNVPTVITVYDMIHELFDFYLPPYHRGWAEKKIAIDRADHIICISENTKKDLIDLFNIEESKISITYLAFERSQLSDKTNNFIINKRPFLLYVGWREWYKNFNNFLISFASSEKLKNDFDIIAFGGGELSKEHKKLINRLGFKEGQVKQIEGDDNLLARFYSAASAFVNPSLYEGFGLTPLEAMSYGCPVVSSNTSSMPEVIGDAAEYFNPESLEDMQQAIENVVYSTSKTDELISAGNKRCNFFSWKRCSDETLSIYKKIIQ